MYKFESKEPVGRGVISSAFSMVGSNTGNIDNNLNKVLWSFIENYIYSLFSGFENDLQNRLFISKSEYKNLLSIYKNKQLSDGLVVSSDKFEEMQKYENKLSLHKIDKNYYQDYNNISLNDRESVQAVQIKIGRNIYKFNNLKDALIFTTLHDYRQFSINRDGNFQKFDTIARNCNSLNTLYNSNNYKVIFDKIIEICMWKFQETVNPKTRTCYSESQLKELEKIIKIKLFGSTKNVENGVFSTDSIYDLEIHQEINNIFEEGIKHKTILRNACTNEKIDLEKIKLKTLTNFSKSNIDYEIREKILFDEIINIKSQEDLQQLKGKYYFNEDQADKLDQISEFIILISSQLNIKNIQNLVNLLNIILKNEHIGTLKKFISKNVVDAEAASNEELLNKIVQQVKSNIYNIGILFDLISGLNLNQDQYEDILITDDFSINESFYLGEKTLNENSKDIRRRCERLKINFAVLPERKNNLLNDIYDNMKCREIMNFKIKNINKNNLDDLEIILNILLENNGFLKSNETIQRKFFQERVNKKGLVLKSELEKQPEIDKKLAEIKENYSIILFSKSLEYRHSINKYTTQQTSSNNEERKDVQTSKLKKEIGVRDKVHQFVLKKNYKIEAEHINNFLLKFFKDFGKLYEEALLQYGKRTDRILENQFIDIVNQYSSALFNQDWFKEKRYVRVVKRPFSSANQNIFQNWVIDDLEDISVNSKENSSNKQKVSSNKVSSLETGHQFTVGMVYDIFKASVENQIKTDREAYKSYLTNYDENLEYEDSENSNIGSTLSNSSQPRPATFMREFSKRRDLYDDGRRRSQTYPAGQAASAVSEHINTGRNRNATVGNKRQITQRAENLPGQAAELSNSRS